MQVRENLREKEKTIECEGKREGKCIHTQERKVYKNEQGKLQQKNVKADATK